MSKLNLMRDKIQILEGIFTGFIRQAYKICNKYYLQKEIDFLMQIFVENGNEKIKVKQIIQK